MWETEDWSVGWLPCCQVNERGVSGGSMLSRQCSWAWQWMVAWESEVLAFLLLPALNEKVDR